MLNGGFGPQFSGDPLMKNLEYRKLLLDHGINIEKNSMELNCDIMNDALSNTLLGLQVLDPQREVTIYLTTDGGSPYAAYGIYDAIRQFPGHVTIVCIGGVFSAGTIIMQSADKRLMTENSTLLIHFGSAYAEDASTAKQHAKMDKRIIEMLVSAVDGKRTKATITKWFERESYFNAKEALDAGLIDGILYNV